MGSFNSPSKFITDLCQQFKAAFFERGFVVEYLELDLAMEEDKKRGDSLDVLDPFV